MCGVNTFHILNQNFRILKEQPCKRKKIRPTAIRKLCSQSARIRDRVNKSAETSQEETRVPMLQDD